MTPGFRVQHDPIRQRALVYRCVGTDERGRDLYSTRGDIDRVPEVIAVEPGHEPPLWDWFPWEVVTALGNALAPRPEVTERHLEDALTVRDRLLALFEAEHMQDREDQGTIHINSEADERRRREAERW